jgi:plasmid replication initiation protein
MAGMKAYSKGMVSKSDRQMATARAIDKDLNPGTIRVSSAKTEGNTVRWTADLPEGRYACTQQKGHMSATCVKE